MTKSDTNSNLKFILPILFGFFVMGFVDVVGIATNYVKIDFDLSDTAANTLPMMVFLWFALFSIPTGILMGKIGRRNTVLVAFIITVFAMLMPLFFYDFKLILIAFALLGIGNTVLQVSLNPMVAYFVNSGKLTSVLTLGQFVKAISSFLGPFIAIYAATYFGDWKWIFAVFALTTLLSAVWMVISIPATEKKEAANATFLSTLILFKNKYIVTLFLGILLIVGIDVGLNTSIPKLLIEKCSIPLSEAGLGTSLYFAARTAGAFFGAFVLARFSSRKFLKISSFIAVFAFIPLLFVSSQWIILSLIAIIGFACSNVFAIIFSFALQSDPTHKNEISALMIMGVSGGALIPPIMGMLSDRFGQTAGFSVLLLCLLYIMFIAYRKQK